MDYVGNKALFKAAGKSSQVTPMEEQMEWDDFEGVLDRYQEFVFQFGSVQSWGSAMRLRVIIFGERLCDCTLCRYANEVFGLCMLARAMEWSAFESSFLRAYAHGYVMMRCVCS